MIAKPTPPKKLGTPPGTPKIPDYIWPAAPLSGFKELWAHSLFVKFLVVSVALHIFAISTITFSKPVREMWNKHQTMEVVLVNSATKSKPTKAEVLAQANLDGGGNVDEDRKASTPLPKLPKPEAQTQLAAEQKKREELEQQVQKLVAQTKAEKPVPKEAPEPQPTPPKVETTPTAAQLLDRSLELMQLEAQIQKDIEAYQKRPRKHFVGSRAEEYRFARYIEDWRLKVERIGNLNYPEAARREKLYGALLMTVAIKSDGSIHEVKIDRSSGHRILDAAAEKIVAMGAPYSEFPADIKRDVDILYITRTWSFTRDNALETRYAPR
jgi:TonB family C-terminal domain